MIEALVSEYPGIRSKLDVLLKQISMSLPLNSLYIDLTNDEKLANYHKKVAELRVDISACKERERMLKKKKNADVDMIMLQKKQQKLNFCCFNEQCVQYCI